MPSSDPQDRFSQTVPDINHQVPKLLDARKLWSQLTSLFGASDPKDRFSPKVPDI